MVYVPIISGLIIRVCEDPRPCAIPSCFLFLYSLSLINKYSHPPGIKIVAIHGYVAFIHGKKQLVSVFAVWIGHKSTVRIAFCVAERFFRSLTVLKWGTTVLLIH